MVGGLIAVLEEFRSSAPVVEAAGARIASCLAGGGRVLACGNGGSAAEAMHFCEELTGRYDRPRRALPALCLNADGSALTCIGNDFGFGEVFARQIEAFGARGDVLVAFSTGGRSPNILRALETAGGLGIGRILLCGKGGGPAAETAETVVVVPSENGARIQEVHALVLHTWIEIIEENLFGLPRARAAGEVRA